jgi:WXXGXW repeat (2 copies)
MVSHTRRRIVIGGAILSFAALLGACANPPPTEKLAVNEVLAPRAPPPPLYESIPSIPPGQGDMATWMPGYWRWDGLDYVWTPGSYIDRPRREAYWVPASWQQRGNSWVYIEGHWA